MSSQIAIEVRVRLERAFDVGFVEAKVGTQAWHPERVALAGGDDVAAVVRQMLAVVEQGIYVGGARNGDPRRFVTSPCKALVAEGDGKPRGRGAVSRDVGQMRGDGA